MQEAVGTSEGSHCGLMLTDPPLHTKHKAGCWEHADLYVKIIIVHGIEVEEMDGMLPKPSLECQEVILEEMIQGDNY